MSFFDKLNEIKNLPQNSINAKSTISKEKTTEENLDAALKIDLKKSDKKEFAPITSFNSTGKRLVMVDDRSYDQKIGATLNSAANLKGANINQILIGSQNLSAGGKPSQNQTINAIAANVTENSIEDKIRMYSGNYWSKASETENIIYLSNDERLPQGILPFTFNFVQSQKMERGIREKLILIKNQNSFKTGTGATSIEYWQTYVRGGEVLIGGSPVQFNQLVEINKQFFDYSFEISLPFTKKELDGLDSLTLPLVVEFQPNYNFYIKNYETSISSTPAVLENTLPNMYAFLSVLKDETPNPALTSLISLAGSIKSETRFAMNKNFDIKTNPAGQYYDLYARQYKNAIAANVTESLARKFSNLLISIDNIDLFQKFNDHREMFPMYVDIQISTDNITTIAQLLKETSLMTSFMTRVLTAQLDNNANNLAFNESTEIVLKSKGKNTKKTVQLDSKSRRVWLVDTLIDSLKEEAPNLPIDRYTFLDDYKNDFIERSEFKFFRSLMSIIFKNKFENYLSQKTRSHQDLLNGKLAAAETVFYRIAKFIGEPSGIPIQNIYLPNSNDIDVLRYIDTQVKYNKKYSYVIYAYQLVVGTEYQYSDLNVFDESAEVTIRTSASPILVEVPFHTFSTRIVDRPPVSPDVLFVPQKGIDNQIRIYLNGNVGDYQLNPIIIQSDDQIIIDRVRESQDLEPGDKVHYSADDHPAAFQIFRLDKKPTTWKDFANALHRTINTDVSTVTIQSATAAAFVDQIEPNKKYYYIFRTIDIHGHISNPTEIYELEMINETGMIFPLIKTVDFAKAEKIQKKSMRRYLQIVPNVLQSLINEEKSGYEKATSAAEVENKIHLGLIDESVWKKKFKIRLTSKSTGKKVDLNVQFDHKPKKQVVNR